MNRLWLLKEIPKLQNIGKVWYLNASFIPQSKKKSERQQQSKCQFVSMGSRRRKDNAESRLDVAIMEHCRRGDTAAGQAVFSRTSNLIFSPVRI